MVHKDGRTLCPGCQKGANWTYHRLVKLTQEKNNYRFDISLVKPEDISNRLSRISIICNTCRHGCKGEWTPSVYDFVDNYLSGNSKCCKCFGMLRYTYDNFIERAREIHGDSYDYSFVKPNMIEGCNSKVPIICKVCNYGSKGEWIMKVGNHVGRGASCPACSGHLPWKFDRFIIRAKTIHGDMYDYSLIREEDVVNGSSEISIICNKCKSTFYRSINSHIQDRGRCRNCYHGKSGGELLIGRILSQWKVLFREQYRIPTNPSKRYDFMFVIRNTNIILEFDGIQHFKYIPFFHKTEDNFLERQQVDRDKTNIAISSGYYLIRIDHTQINKIEYHIRAAIDYFSNSTNKLYLSNWEMYLYLNVKPTVYLNILPTKSF